MKSQCHHAKPDRFDHLLSTFGPIDFEPIDVDELILGCSLIIPKPVGHPSLPVLVTLGGVTPARVDLLGLWYL